MRAIGVSRLVDKLRGGLFSLRYPANVNGRGAPADRRRADTYPGPHPFGWYRLLDSDEVAPGQVVPVEALGEDLVVFRTKAGVLSVMHARCPHLGANLGGGRLVDDCIECPFHGWRFASDGGLACVPYTDKPPRARVRTWPARELYGMIFIYHGPAEADPPPYVPDYWPELDSATWSFRGRYAPRDVRMHILEFAENSVDFQHFGKLHGSMRVPWTPLRLPGVTIRHAARWELDAEKPHVSHFYDDAHLIVLGKDLPKTAAHGHVTFVGPASFVVFRLAVPKVGDVLIAQTHTPVDAPDAPLLLRTHFRWWAENTVPAVLTSYIVGNWISQWWQDVEIWEGKVHLPRPLLARGDGPLHTLRRWYQQFYPQGV
jgi:cholesterol 7-dehydrogenase